VKTQEGLKQLNFNLGLYMDACGGLCSSVRNPQPRYKGEGKVSFPAFQHKKSAG
jgi:hypothetical protein